MPYPIERKLVVAVSSNALFDLTKEDEIFQTKGVDAFNKYQIQNKTKVISKGLAFPFIRRYLNINKFYKEEEPVEVVLLSKNSPQAGNRILHSIKEYGLNISRCAFTSGQSPYKYIPAFNISLFLSINENDVLNAIKENYPAGRFIQTKIEDDEQDLELRIAFDFDGVIIDDQAEAVFKESGQLKMFHEFEVKNAMTAHNPGPLAEFFKKLSFFQKLESRKQNENSKYEKILKTAIITARNAPAHERVINTLGQWGVEVDEMFLLGGIEKKRILEVFKPHLFLDDQLTHLDAKLENIPLVHIPFGIANKSDATQDKL
jgi:5'-nucleotidase